MTVRNKFLMMLSFFAMLLLFNGCATQVPVQRLVPAKYSMVDYRELAVPSVKPYRSSISVGPTPLVADLSGTAPFRVYSGYQSFSERNLANHVTSLLVAELEDTNYFTLLRPPEADLLGKRLASSIQAILEVEVKRMDVEEYIYARKVVPKDPADTTESMIYYLQQKVVLEIGYRVIDVETEMSVYNDSFQQREERSYVLDHDKGPVLYAPDITPVLREMGSKMVTSLVNSLAPRQVTFSISLMSNRPKVNHIKSAYKAAKGGQLGYAYALFSQEWELSRHLPSGYNGALLLEALQRRDEAIAFMEDVWRSSGSSKAKRQLDRMRRYEADQGKAESQF